MFYNGIIFDLDNTLYDYDVCHQVALEDAINYILPHCNINDDSICYDSIYYKYKSISSKLKNELINTASSHNKSIYFKHLIEELRLNYSLVTSMTNIYWKTFYDKMECFDGLKEFIIWNKNVGKKIGVLTDYETEYQVIKLEKLGLLEYIDIVLTSEEVGIEKPSMQMFQTLLRQMNLLTEEVIMIGDNYEKDIQGAVNMGILSYWLTKNNNTNNELYAYNGYSKYIEFNNFSTLHLKFKEIGNELNKFKMLSKYCGERFDLVQAGGGNSSVKIDDWMFIKSSGYHLSSIELDKGYVIINNEKLKRDINNICNDCNSDTISVVNYNVIGNNRGSIETFMHSILKKYTIHLHPIQLNRLLIKENGREICQTIYPKALIIDYLTPGIKVCQAINRIYNNEQVILLLNHGLIITSDSYDEIYTLLDNVLKTFETYCKYNFEKYKYTNTISRTINNVFNIENVSYLCEDRIINDYLLNNPYLFKEKITFPDALIYCGIQLLFVDSIMLLQNGLCDYKNKYNEHPKIIVICEENNNNNIYITSHSLNKCKDIEEVLKANLFILDSEETKNYLSLEEICFLNNWDAEKYRKLL